MKLRLNLLLLTVLVGFCLVTLLACGGGGGGLLPGGDVFGFKWIYKTIKLFKDPQVIATVKEPLISTDHAIHAGQVGKATISIKNNTDAAMTFRVDNETVDIPDRSIPQGESSIWELDPGTYTITSPGSDSFGETSVTLTAAMAYVQDVVDAQREFKQKYEKANPGNIISEEPTGVINEDTTPYVIPNDQWGSISVTNNADKTFNQYLDGVLMFNLAPGETKTYATPPGNHIISNSTDMEDPDAAFLWFDIRPQETREITIEKNP
jgi:hypothetical protein